MRILLDTNVLIAAFTAHGSCAELLEHCAINHRVFISHFILSEFRRNLVRKCRLTPREAENAGRLLESQSETVSAAPPERQICRDRDDDNIIAAAIAGSCDCLVTGSKDLLELKKVAGVRIVSPAEFWKHEARHRV